MIEIQFFGEDGCALHASVVGSGPPFVLLHGGGPDRWSFMPIARALQQRFTVVLPDIRGYGQSVCRDPRKHTWQQYANDVFALCDHLGLQHAALGGAGLGASVVERAALSHPERVTALVLISPEKPDEAGPSEAELELMRSLGARALSEGLEAAWSQLLPLFPPIIQNMVREAIPRTDPASFAAAVAIVNDKRFEHFEELRALTMPTLVVAGNDPRHPRELGEQYVSVLPGATRAEMLVWEGISTPEAFAARVVPLIEQFLVAHART